MSSRSADDQRPPGGSKSTSNVHHDGQDTIADISMEDTDAAAQRIPEGMAVVAATEAPQSSDEKSQEPRPGESFTGAQTITPATFIDDDLPDFLELASVQPDSYVFGAEIARGGMGRILSARDRRTGRYVAIKEILPPLMASLSAKEKDAIVARFQREAHVTARLQHPSIVPVYEIGNFDGRPFFAMKKVDGRGLDELIKARTTLAERLELLPTIVSLAEALAYAHGQRVIHRDLKSSNILVGAFGETVVIDWGLAKDLSSDEKDDDITTSSSSHDSVPPLQTVVGSIFGTPHYMPPEQARGDTVDERADVYAIGSILYHLLSGTPPYEDSETALASGSLLKKLREVPPEPLTSMVADIPRDLLSIVDKAMSRDKAQRYPTAAELATDLADFTAGQRVAVHHYSTSELLARWLRRHKTAIATAVVFLAALMVTATVSVRSVLESRDEAKASAKAAIEQKQRADDTTDDAMRFLAERGRIDLLEDRPLEALLLLTKAYEHLEYRPPHQVLVASAMRSIDAKQKTLKPHDAPISNLATTHDGTRLVSSADDGEVRIYDLGSGEQTNSFWARTKWVESVPSLSRDDTKIVLPGEEGFTVWNTATGKEIASRAGDFIFAQYDHKDRVITVTRNGEVAAWTDLSADRVVLYRVQEIGPWGFPHMSRDGKSLLLARKMLYAIDLVEDRLRGKVFALGLKLIATDSGLDSKRFVTGNGLGYLRLWSLDPLKTIATLDFHNGIRNNLAVSFSPDGKVLAAAAPNGTVAVYDVETGEMLSSIESPKAGFRRILFSPDSERVVALAHDEVVRIWDVAAGRLRIAFIGAAGYSSDAAFSVDGKSLYVGDSAGGITKWDANADIIRKVYDGEGSFSARDSTGRRLLTSSGEALVLLDSHTHEVIAKLGQRELLPVARFSEDGNRIFTGNQVFSSRDGLLVRDIGADASESSIAGISRDGSVVAMSNKDRLRVWNVDSGKVIYESAHGTRFNMPLWLGSKGDYLLTFVDNFELAMIDFSTGAVLKHFKNRGVTRDFVTHLANPYYVVINRYPSEMEVVDVRTGEVIRALTGDFTAISAAPDGVRILAATNTVGVLWNTETGEVEQRMEVPLAKSIYSTAVSTDGHFLALASHNGVLLYDRESKTLILEVTLGSETIRDLVFGPSDDTLVISATRRAFIVDINRETRDPATIEALVRKAVPRILKNGLFLPAPSLLSKRKLQDQQEPLPKLRSLFRPIK